MRGGVSLLVCFLAVLPAIAAGPARPDPEVLAAEIDRLIAEKLHAQRVEPVPRADDATFFRRIHLALAGRIPMPAEVRAFLADTRPDKRARAVERLLHSAAFANHLTTSWRGWLLPEAVTNQEIAGTVPAFEAWLHRRIRSGMPIDRLVTELLTFPLDGRQAMGRAAPVDDADGATGPLAFYTAKEGKPENLAAATARVFLGVHLECAQCHNHPFARWSREQFWGLAAFYGGVERSQGGGLRELPGRRELLIPNSDRAVPATFLDDREPEWQYKKSPRATLAAWLTASENPFFARAMANRLWWWVFGVGLVDPVDDFHDSNPPSHPKLLDVLARGLVDAGFDVRFVLRAICLSETFGRASLVREPERQDVRLFAHFPLQALSPEQLFDSLAVVLGVPLEGPGGAYLQRGGARRQFQETFAVSDRPTAGPTTILQALTLMNGDLVGGATGTNAGRTLAAVVDLPGLAPAERVEALYLAVLGRPPQPHELARVLRHVERGDAATVKARYGDVLWALLNSVEFRTNH